MVQWFRRTGPAGNLSLRLSAADVGCRSVLFRNQNPLSFNSSWPFMGLEGITAIFWLQNAIRALFFTLMNFELQETLAATLLDSHL